METDKVGEAALMGISLSVNICLWQCSANIIKETMESDSSIVFVIHSICCTGIIEALECDKTVRYMCIIVRQYLADISVRHCCDVSL